MEDTEMFDAITKEGRAPSPAVNEPVCGDECDGMRCHLPQGHDGEHEGLSTDGSDIVEQWYDMRTERERGAQAAAPQGAHALALRIREALDQPPYASPPDYDSPRQRVERIIAPYIAAPSAPQGGPDAQRLPPGFTLQERDDKHTGAHGEPTTERHGVMTTTAVKEQGDLAGRSPDETHQDHWANPGPFTSATAAAKTLAEVATWHIGVEEKTGEVANPTRLEACIAKLEKLLAKALGDASEDEERSQRMDRDEAQAAIESHLWRYFFGDDSYTMVEDGISSWAFSIGDGETAAYLKSDGSIEHYGHELPSVLRDAGDRDMIQRLLDELAPPVEGQPRDLMAQIKRAMSEVNSLRKLKEVGLWTSEAPRSE